MTTFLLCWYALGWAALGIGTKLRGVKNISLSDVMLVVGWGGISFIIAIGIWANENNCLRNPVLWRKP